MLKYFVIAPPVELNCPSFCVLFLVLFLQCLSCYLPFSLSSWVSCVKEGKGSFGLTTVKWCTLRECPSSFLDFVWLFVFWLRKFIESFWGSLEELRLKWKGKHGYVYKRMSRSVFFFANACVYLFFFFSFNLLTNQKLATIWEVFLSQQISHFFHKKESKHCLLDRCLLTYLVVGS